MSLIEDALKWHSTYVESTLEDVPVMDWNMVRISRSVLVDEYCKLRDTTPIDEAFAGKVRSENVQVLGHGNGWMIRVWNDLSDKPFVEARRLTARGQVRCLLLAAGIECEA